MRPDLVGALYGAQHKLDGTNQVTQSADLQRGKYTLLWGPSPIFPEKQEQVLSQCCKSIPL